jgi:hypothetical protein
MDYGTALMIALIVYMISDEMILAFIAFLILVNS